MAARTWSHRISGSRARTLYVKASYEIVDVTEKEMLERVVREHEIDAIFHLAAILSATGERDPQLAWHVNIRGLHNVLEVARELSLVRVFHPSSIAVFGPETPKDMTCARAPRRPFYARKLYTE